MSQEKLTIDQKIAIAKMAVDLYSIEFNAGHKSSLREGFKPDAPSGQNERDALWLDWQLKDIRTDFQHIFHTIENAVLQEKDSD